MSGKKWVLLVAGSKGWDNYQHQANVCCFYQLIKQHGIPENQIVVMMYDDIANNPQNPFKGNITSVIKEIANVYPSVPKDYIKENVTPKKFLDALQGDGRSGKAIYSGSNDEIFIYMSSLGNEGTFTFPEQNLCANDLLGVINSMYNGKKFSKMVIYMDSNKSESMLKSLSQFQNVYAVTSCDLTHDNYSSDYDPTRRVQLSDEFSSALLKFIHVADFKMATLKSLFEFLKTCDTSNPCQLGDMKISDCPLGEFLQN